MISTAILIPARYNSKRLPGKPLCMLDGVPMIRRVYDACVASKIPTYVLTDDRRIADVIPKRHSWTDEVDEYANGTERCAGALKHSPLLTEYTNFINVQGDMPNVTIDMIQKTIEQLKNYSVTTVWSPLLPGDLLDKNKVKVITAGDRALWFGRGFSYGHHHLGIYGYRRDTLSVYPTLEVTREEHNEGLEQLRWLKAGYNIGALETEFTGVEINNASDVELWNEN